MGRPNHDWTLCPELMARRYPPASSWPSVSDIPPGMLVLDADGVVKQCRFVANDYVGAYIALDSAPCLFNENWEIQFTVNSKSTLTDRRIYSEGSQTSDVIVLGIGSQASDCKKLRVFLRGSDLSQCDANFSTPVFNGEYNRCKVRRVLNKIGLSVNSGTFEEITIQTSSIIPVSSITYSTIGALIRSGVSADFEGEIFDFQKNGLPIIPLNQNSGKTIFDVNGNIAGSLVDPNNSFWAKRLIPVSML